MVRRHTRRIQAVLNLLRFVILLARLYYSLRNTMLEGNVPPPELEGLLVRLTARACVLKPTNQEVLRRISSERRA